MSVSTIQSIWYKFKQRPIQYLATASFVGVAAYGLAGARNRNMKLSLYLINTRLAAQGSLALILAVGMIYTIVQRDVVKNPEYQPKYED